MTYSRREGETGFFMNFPRSSSRRSPRRGRPRPAAAAGFYMPMYCSSIDVASYNTDQEQVSIPIAELQRLKVTIGLLTYDNLWISQFGTRLFELRSLLADANVACTLLCTSGSLIQVSRNLIASKLLAEGGPNDRLIFVDADSDFDAADIIRMLNANVDVIGIPYAKKMIDWQAVHAAVHAGASADELPFLATKNNVQFLADHISHFDAPIEVCAVGTGTMCIKWDVLHNLASHTPAYTLPEAMQADWGIRTAWDFFGNHNSPEHGPFIGEDVGFCQNWRQLGGKVFCLPAKTKHIGLFAFECDWSVKVRCGVPL
jgi:hypothetical protein